MDTRSPTGHEYCPDCRLPVAHNEYSAYGRHEDCWVGNAPHGQYSSLPMALRLFAIGDGAGGGRWIKYHHEPGM